MCSRYSIAMKEIFPTDPAPIVIGDASIQAKFGFARWDGKGVMLNARSETLQTVSTFKHRVQIGRCVIPASEYYEWKNKIKHAIKSTDGAPLSMAGLWRDDPENNGREFVIITKNTFGSIADIHGRMPVLLRPKEHEAWLNGTLSPTLLPTLEYECYAEAVVGPQLTLF